MLNKQMEHLKIADSKGEFTTTVMENYPLLSKIIQTALHQQVKQIYLQNGQNT